MSWSGGIVDIGAWLRGSGMGRYEAAFRENAMDRDVLPSLTAEDLRELGVTSVGDGGPNDRRGLGDPDVITGLQVGRTLREMDADPDLAEVPPDGVEVDVGPIVVAHASNAGPIHTGATSDGRHPKTFTMPVAGGWSE